ncbi:hypothetical protein D6774_01315 [Candidatus Woesearchaeota archaeon]|jgi:DNA-binding transcriptional MerR regulator|nr:MAG: hypothetical protein D6774_01315 [Candidatus Woesearchaeota archaeon]
MQYSDTSTLDPATEQLLKQVLHYAKQKGITLEKIQSLYTEEGEQTVPLAAFASELSPSEGLCKYLKDHYDLTYAQIAALLNRDDRSIWTSINRAEKKHPGPFNPDSDIRIPVKIFADRSHSILEHVIIYLQEHFGYTIYKIAKLLNKKPSALYAIAKRGHAKE